MHASKENATKAEAKLTQLEASLREVVRNDWQEAFNFLKNFIAATSKRLPTEQAIARDKERKAAYNEARKKPGRKPAASAAEASPFADSHP